VPESSARETVDNYITLGVKTSIAALILIYGGFMYWFYTSLRTISRSMKELEATYMGPEIIAPVPNEQPIQYVAVAP